MKLPSILQLVAFCALLFMSVLGDIYMHNPRGSNDRNCGRVNNNNRENANRLFNSENNDKGGYSCPRSFPFPCYKYTGAERTACNNQNTVDITKAMVDFEGNIVESQITRADVNFPVVPPTKNGVMYYYEGSELMIEWTNQHGFGQNDELHSNVVIQYACDDTLSDSCGEIPDDIEPEENIFTIFKGREDYNICTLRDGYPVNNKNDDSALNGQATVKIPFTRDPADEAVNNQHQDDYRYGRHETLEYYRQCIYRKRNTNLYTSDQNPRNDVGATATRQNPNGDADNNQRYGYECAEEHDYYPYWHWSPWRDIANVVSDSKYCELFRKESGNVRKKGRCFGCTTCSEPSGQPNNELECKSPAQGGLWIEDKALGGGAPKCVIAPRGQENHLGNIQNGHKPHFNWTIPSPPNGKDKARCVLRLRYNITPGDYGNEAQLGTSLNNNANALIQDDEKTAGELMAYKPIVEEDTVESGETIPKLALNINSDQYGRTFQDRSYVFEIRKRPNDLCVLKSQKIHNVNVRGKRGNIVQTYPAVEYDFVPTQLTCQTTEAIHIQWIGSDYNPNRNGNDGEGGPYDPQEDGRTRCDRSNLIEVSKASDNNPVSNVDSSRFLSSGSAMKLALLGQTDCKDIEQILEEIPDDKGAREAHFQNCAKLNAADSPYFDAGVFCCGPKTGIFHFMGTRNNNFSNRDQKFALTVKRDLKLVIGLSVGAALVVIAAAGFYAYRKYYKSKLAKSKTQKALETTGPEGEEEASVVTASLMGTRVKAEFDHEATEQGELSFKKGQLITVVKKDASGWWQGEINGRQGIFPSSYVSDMTSL